IAAIEAQSGAYLDRLNLWKVLLLGFGTLVAIASGVGFLILGIFLATVSSRIALRKRILPMLEEMYEQPECREEAIDELLERTGDFEFLRKPTRVILQTYTDQLANSPRLTGKSGYACANLREWGLMINLFNASNTVKGWESWMVFNYVNAHIYNGDIRKAAELSTWALEKLVPDHSTDAIKTHQTWLLVINGDVENAKIAKSRCPDKPPNYTGVEAANSGASVLINFQEGKLSAKEAFEQYFLTLDRTKLSANRVEIAFHYEMLQRFSKEDISLYQKLICFYGLWIAFPNFLYRRHQIKKTSS
ncbi:MAG: hypothetical protein KJT03_23900, partial [Verrucomicrobiae bacterium]|nr:hypothetical protein [Verrucomicrobiae bacterium]